MKLFLGREKNKGDVTMNIVELKPIQDWAMQNEPSKEMGWYDGYWNQICFVRDQIGNLLFSGEWEAAREKITVISTHVSKSIVLPVYHIDLRNNYGVEIVMRNNFYDWKISIKSLIHINTDFMNLFKEDSPISSLYCEGMPEDKVYGMYKHNKNEFTVEIYDQYQLYTFMWLLRNHLESR